MALQPLLKGVLETHTTMTAITKKHSQERIQLLTHANTHGMKFYATGGSPVCSDNFFKADALCCCEVTVKVQGI